MKLQDVILKAMAKRLSWIEAAEIAGMSVRNMQRMRQRYQEFGYRGLFDQRRGKRSVHRIPMETAERVLEVYQERYFDLSVRHFHEKLGEEHGIGISYSWVKQALQGAGLIQRRGRRGPHRRRRPRRPLPGMMLHIDGSKHRWLNDDRYYDLLVILDDATSEIYYAQLVEEESTRTVMAALREVIEIRGLFCSLYSDRGSHFFVTRKAGEKVDPHRLTQVGRALKELGIQMIPAYSPQAGPLGTELRHVAEPAAAGVAAGGVENRGGGQPLSAGALYLGVQPEVRAGGGGEGDGLSAMPQGRSGRGVFGADAAAGRAGQYGDHPRSVLAIGEDEIPAHAGRLYGNHLRTPGWPGVGALGAARSGLVRPRRASSGKAQTPAPWKRWERGSR